MIVKKDEKSVKKENMTKFLIFFKKNLAFAQRI